MTETDRTGFSVDLREANGALADIGTLLPLAIGVIAISGLSAQPVLMGFGLFYIATGLVYRLPIPVQPMKAIAAVAMVSAVTPGAIALSGLLVGLMLLLLGATGLIDRIARLVPQSVLAGLQLGLGLGLGWIALGLMRDQWIIGGVTLAVALAGLRLGTHAALLAIGAGIALGLGIGHPGWPELDSRGVESWVLPGFRPDDLLIAVTDLALPQLALTLTNAVFLTALLAQDRFGGSARHVTPRRLCVTSGTANLLLAPIGALPMCHGAGGLAAHHRFGARTGAAPIIIGLFLLVLAGLDTDMLAFALSAIPAGALGALLLVAAGELAFSRRLIDAVPSCRPVIAVTAIGTVFVNPLVGLIVGTVAEVIRKHWVSRRFASRRQNISVHENARSKD